MAVYAVGLLIMSAMLTAFILIFGGPEPPIDIWVEDHERRKELLRKYGNKKKGC